MKNIFMMLLFSVTLSTLFAQQPPPNSAIFGGGNNDGFDKTNFTQAANNIFFGGTGDGYDKTGFTQSVNNIFIGGSGDGWDKTAFTQSVNNIFIGGSGDGWDKTRFTQSGNNIFLGGNGDGWDKSVFAQAGNNIFLGGDGDGWASAYRPLGPLPVTLLYFTAKKNTVSSALLNWKTSQEINSASFDVERSVDAIFFTKIGLVHAAGNSLIPVEYFFTDNNPAKGMNYYRLKQIDVDGRSVYSPARVVMFDGLNAATVKYYPNPTNGILNIEISSFNVNEVTVINITNAAGIVVNQYRFASISGNKIQIDLSRYAKGTYFIQVRTPTLNSTQRVVLN